MGFGDVLDAAFQVYRSAFWQLALIQAAVAVPVALVQSLALHDTVTSGAALSLAVVERNLPWSLLTGLLGLAQAAAVGALAQQAVAGEPLHPGAAYSGVLRRLPSLAGFGIVGGIVVGLLSMVFVIPGLVAFVYLAPALFLVTLGGEGVFRAVGHSLRLVQGYFWRVLGVLLMAGLLVFIINLFVSLVATVVSNPLQNPLGAAVSVIAVTTMLSALLGSFPIVALYLQYVDLRVRKGEVVAD